MKVEKDLNISVERIESLHESQTGEMEEADDSDTLPLALCQVECPDSPIDNTQVTLLQMSCAWRQRDTHDYEYLL